MRERPVPFILSSNYTAGMLINSIRLGKSGDECLLIELVSFLINKKQQKNRQSQNSVGELLMTLILIQIIHSIHFAPALKYSKSQIIFLYPLQPFY